MGRCWSSEGVMPVTKNGDEQTYTHTHTNTFSFLSCTLLRLMDGSFPMFPVCLAVCSFTIAREHQYSS